MWFTRKGQSWTGSGVWRVRLPWSRCFVQMQCGSAAWRKTPVTVSNRRQTPLCNNIPCRERQLWGHILMKLSEWWSDDILRELFMAILEIQSCSILCINNCYMLKLFLEYKRIWGMLPFSPRDAWCVMFICLFSFRWLWDAPVFIWQT